MSNRRVWPVKSGAVCETTVDVDARAAVRENARADGTLLRRGLEGRAAVL